MGLFFGAVGVTPAWAHATFQGLKVLAEAESEVNLFVPHEQDEATYNVEVVVAVPADWQALACTEKPSWTCSLSMSGQTPTITFTKGPGTERADDENFAFRVRSPGAAVSSSFPTRQVYSNGVTMEWSGPPGSQKPAPLLRTLAPGENPAEPEPVGAPDEGSPAIQPPAPALAGAGTPPRSTPIPVAGTSTAAGQDSDTVLFASVLAAALTTCGLLAVQWAYQRGRHVEP
jgi:uncharacterized protein YcnI